MNRIYHAGSREVAPANVDLVRELSDLARQTRKPGQTLSSRFKELSQGVQLSDPGFVA